MLIQDDRKFQAVILAGLLHDIGKFMQRAEIPLSSQSKNMENTICPSFKGIHSHYHVLWTNEFFEKYFIKSYPQFSYLEDRKDNLANLASYHHSDNPETSLQMIIQSADHLSSGMDRFEKDLEDEISGKSAYKKIKLDSIFESIDLGLGEFERGNFKYELRPLILDRENLFPKKRKDQKQFENELLIDDYKKLWDGFIREFNYLPKENFNLFLQALLYLLEKYTWCIPSSTIDLPDISLFDHLKTTAALSACLYNFYTQTNDFSNLSIKNKKMKKLIFLGGDLSGIQKYIFNFSLSNTKGVSKLLRARSFYIGALSNICSHYLLQSLNLPLVCKVIDAGGRFSLLVPNTDQTKERLINIYQEISEWFRKEFMGELVLNLNWDLALAEEDFRIEEFSKIISNLEENLEKTKYNKLKEAIIRDSKWKEESFIFADAYKYEKGVCSVCGKKPATISTIGENKDSFCNLCFNLSKVGEWLTKKKVFAYSHKKPPITEYISFLNEKYYLSFWSTISQLDPKEFYLIEDLDTSFHREKTIYGKRYLANYVPLWNSKEEFEQLCQFCNEIDSCEFSGNIGISKTFQCISLKGIDREKEKGTAMLGILKADVDRLGFIFSVGLGKKISLSRYSTLSREIDLFFSGYLNEIISKQYRNIYVVYAGGDDLFLVSDWQTIIDFSKSLYDDFRNFTCQNPNITLSAGLVITKPRYPIRRSAEIAEEALESSKNKGRNRFTLFNHTIPWSEFESLQKFADFLDKNLDNSKSGITMGFIYRLLNYYKNYLLFLERRRIDGLKFYSQVAYDVGRNIIKRDDKDKRIINLEVIKELKDKIYDFEKADESFLKNLRIPLTWALYKNRKINKRG